MSKIELKYRTSEKCDYGDREVTMSIERFVDKSDKGLGALVNLLVDRGVITSDDAYDAFKSSDDYELIQVFGGSGFDE